MLDAGWDSDSDEDDVGPEYTDVGTQTGICLGSFGYTIGHCHTAWFPFESESLEKSSQTCCNFLPASLMQEFKLML
jgi:hypothetical protein